MDSLEHPGVSVRPFCWDPRPSALAVRTHGGHTPGHLAYFRGRDGVLITCDPDHGSHRATTAT